MTLDIQNIKQRFEIIGTDPNLDRAIEKAMRVSPTDISVLITGESGVGKEIFPKIIHQLSHRKHNKFIAVNCGAIPEGTIDSELFGHEKGAFTGATSTRSGYFEVADGGTIFLDEVGELPMTTQVRLLRVLENGEFIKVGSSKVQKTNVRIVAATNVNMDSAIQKNKFSRVYGYSTASILFIHFLINIGMVLGLTPTIGIPLPFLSYGGSSLIAFTILLFVFLRLDANKINEW